MYLMLYSLMPIEETGMGVRKRWAAKRA